MPFPRLSQYVQVQAQLERFKKSSNIRVLCLTLHKGANGLNLTEANHVFLIEPSINPAAEAQAIGNP